MLHLFPAKRQRLYVAGPMSNVGPPTWNFPAFNAAAEGLRAAGYDVVNPADHGINDGWEWADYMRLALSAMLTCEGVATLPGWLESRGATLEVHVAKALGMPVRPVEHWLAEARNSARVMTPESE